MEERAATEDDSTRDDRVVMTFTVRDARAVISRTLFALVDVELEIAGVTLIIHGVQARRTTGGSTAIELPMYRGADGTWRPAISLPAEVRGPLSDAVLEFLLEEGLARRRYEAGG